MKISSTMRIDLKMKIFCMATSKMAFWVFFSFRIVEVEPQRLGYGKRKKNKMRPLKRRVVVVVVLPHVCLHMLYGACRMVCVSVCDGVLYLIPSGVLMLTV